MTLSSGPRYLSPLRYPGGKDRLATFVANLIKRQPNPPTTYIEPFAGGGAVGLRLLHAEVVDEVVLNDLDPGVAAFWRAVMSDTSELTSLIRCCKPTIDEWHAQHERHAAASGDDVELGFATFFLNRTNRSGILDARPIGGFDQSGRWGIGARYNGAELAERIERIARYGTRITVSETDGIALVREHVCDTQSFIYADPPYLRDGDHLYLNTLRWPDHVRLAKYLRRGGRWLVTYDDDPRVRNDLYPDMRCAIFAIAHTAAARHVGRERAVFADALVVDKLDGLGQRPRFLPRRRSN